MNDRTLAPPGLELRLCAAGAALYLVLSAACRFASLWMDSVQFPLWGVVMLGPPVLLLAGDYYLVPYVVATIAILLCSIQFWWGAARDSELGIWGLLGVLVVWLFYSPSCVWVANF